VVDDRGVEVLDEIRHLFVAQLALVAQELQKDVASRIDLELARHASDHLIELRWVIIERLDELPVETPPALPPLRAVEEDLVEQSSNARRTACRVIHAHANGLPGDDCFGLDNVLESRLALRLRRSALDRAARSDRRTPRPGLI